MLEYRNELKDPNAFDVFVVLEPTKVDDTKNREIHLCTYNTNHHLNIYFQLDKASPVCMCMTPEQVKELQMALNLAYPPAPKKTSEIPVAIDNKVTVNMTVSYNVGDYESVDDIKETIRELVMSAQEGGQADGTVQFPPIPPSLVDINEV